MTLLIATLCDGFAVVSQDSAIGHQSEMDRPASTTPDAHTAAAETLTGNGLPPADQPAAFGCKLLLLPQFHAVIAGTGSYWAFVQYGLILNAVAAAWDVTDLDQAAPEALRGVLGRFPGGTALTVVQVGYSRQRGNVAGYAYASGDGFKSVPLQLSSHTITPTPATDDPGYGEVAERWNAAARGEGTEAFHVSLAACQHRTYRRGLYRDGSLIGGQLHLARIDHAGITVKVAHEFPDFRAQLAAIEGRLKAA